MENFSAISIFIFCGVFSCAHSERPCRFFIWNNWDNRRNPYLGNPTCIYRESDFRHITRSGWNTCEEIAWLGILAESCNLVPTTGVYRFLLDIYDESIKGNLSLNEGMLWESFIIVIYFLFGIVFFYCVVCSPFAVLFMADRDVTIKTGVMNGVGAVSDQVVKVGLLHLGWMVNAGVLALVAGLVGYIISFLAPENLFILSLRNPLELGLLAEDVSEETGEITLNLATLLLEYVGLAIGFGIGLCTVAVAYAQVLGLPGCTHTANVEQ